MKIWSRTQGLAGRVDNRRRPWDCLRAILALPDHEHTTPLANQIHEFRVIHRTTVDSGRMTGSERYIFKPKKCYYMYARRQLHILPQPLTSECFTLLRLHLNSIDVDIMNSACRHAGSDVYTTWLECSNKKIKW